MNPQTNTTNPSDQIQSLISDYKASNPQAPVSSPSGSNDWYSGVKSGSYRPAGTDTQDAGFFQRTLADTKKRAQDVAEAVTAPAKAVERGASASEVARRVGETGLRTAGAVAGGIADTGFEALKSTPIVGKLISGIFDKVGNTEAAQKLAEALKTFSDAHPDVAKDIGAGVDIAGLVGAGAGGKEVAQPAQELLQSAKTAASETAGKVAEAVPSAVKSPINLARDFATPIDENVKNVLMNGNKAELEPKLKSYFDTARTAIGKTGADTPFDVAGKTNFKGALDSIKTKLDEFGKLKGQALAENGSKPVSVGVGSIDATTGEATKASLVDRFVNGLQEKLGTKIDAKGNLIDAPGRVSVISNSAADTKLVNLVKNTLVKLGDTPTLRQVNDAVDAMQGEIYKSKVLGAEPINNTAEGFVKSIIGDLNSRAKEVGGADYIAANKGQEDLISLKDDLNRRLGANFKNAGSLTKKIFSPQDGGVKELLRQVESRTGIPIFQDATLAKFAMDAVGDPRAKSLLEQLPMSKRGVIDKALNFVQERLKDPEGKALRIMQK